MWYDKYNTSRDLGEEEIEEEKTHVADCLNTTLTALALNGTSPAILNSTELRANILQTCRGTFKFDMSNKSGMLQELHWWAAVHVVLQGHAAA
jgi:hypothetical protein